MGTCSSVQQPSSKSSQVTSNLSNPLSQSSLPHDYVYYKQHGLILWEVRNLHLQLHDGIMIANNPVSITTTWKLEQCYLSKKWELTIGGEVMLINLDVTTWQKFDNFAVRVRQSAHVLATWTFLPYEVCNIICEYIQYEQKVAVFLQNGSVNLTCQVDGMSIEEHIHHFCHNHIEPQIRVSEFDGEHGVYKTLTCTEREHRITRDFTNNKCTTAFTLTYKGTLTIHRICISDGKLHNPCPRLLVIRRNDAFIEKFRYLKFGGSKILIWSN